MRTGKKKKNKKTNVILWWVIIGLMALPFGQCLINKVVSTLILLMKYCQKVIAFSHFYWWNFLFFSEKSYQISSWDEMTVSTTSWKLIIGSYSDHRICHPDTLMERCPRWEKVWWGRTFPIWNVAFPSISRNISYWFSWFFFRISRTFVISYFNCCCEILEPFFSISQCNIIWKKKLNKLARFNINWQHFGGKWSKLQTIENRWKQNAQKLKFVLKSGEIFSQKIFNCESYKDFFEIF